MPRTGWILPRPARYSLESKATTKSRFYQVVPPPGRICNARHAWTPRPILKVPRSGAPTSERRKQDLFSLESLSICLAPPGARGVTPDTCVPRPVQSCPVRCADADLLSLGSILSTWEGHISGQIWRFRPHVFVPYSLSTRVLYI